MFGAAIWNRPNQSFFVVSLPVHETFRYHIGWITWMQSVPPRQVAF